MTHFEISGWNDTAAWTDYGGQSRSHLDVRLKAACPMLGATERKRLTRGILRRERSSFDLEDSRYAETIIWFLASLGAEVTTSCDEPTKA